MDHVEQLTMPRGAIDGIPPCQVNFRLTLTLPRSTVTPVLSYGFIKSTLEAVS
jgi:hypothetical protein